ncbi:unnamed protein product [Cuscuta campestris]|uniref:F-box domain-containing protein n=1 Tax=Cuscuta campestris TaxID=132261 RepID=A0A484LX19_9ASTE|nr:unnamed protein product [Cuscuta campestris]
MRGVIDSSVMVIQRTTAWVSSHLLCFLVCPNKGFGFGPFPDDILINILSRLPADAVLRCRKVCRHWRSLTSSTDFIALQNQRAPSVLLVHQHQSSDAIYMRSRYYVYDAPAKKLRRISFKSKFGFEGRAKQFTRVSLSGACGPLLHYRVHGNYNGWWGIHNFAFNLFTRQLGALKMRGDGYKGVCGMFFNEPRNKYNYLYMLRNSKESFRFYVYSLDSRTDEEIACSSFLCQLCSGRSPVVVNRALYLMVYPFGADKDDCKHAVLVFEMDSGNFHTLPHPEFECPRTELHHIDMHLFVHDGHLCMCHSDLVRGHLDLWILEDYANWHWVPLASTITLPVLEDPSIPYEIYSVRNDELLVFWYPSLYIVNLKDVETVEEIKIPRLDSECCVELVVYKSTLVAPPLVWDESKPPLFRL